MLNLKINVLVGDNTAEFGVKVASQLREQGIYAYTRKKDGKALLEAIISDTPDVVIVDLTLPDTDAILLMRQVKEKLAVVPEFIIVSDICNSFIERQALECGASYFLTTPFETSELSGIIKSVVRKPVHSDCTDIEIMVTDVIHKLGVPAHIKGYHYLRSAIINAVEDQSLMDSITKLLYPLVASRHNTTSSRVERAIRHAIEIAWNRGNDEIINSFFGCTIDTYRGRPTNSEFIALVSDKLRLKLKNNEKHLIK